MSDVLDEGRAAILQGLAEWIESETGSRFPDVHGATVLKAALERCAELGSEPGDYVDILSADPDEKRRFLDGVMIGETYFFRDERHFRVLLSLVLPALLREGRPLRLWSASCATGEEAVSLAAAMERAKADSGFPVEYSILATDISEASLLRLRSGRFPQSSLRGDGRDFHFLLDPCGGMDALHWAVSPEILARMTIRELNILSGDLPEPESMDIVFFRNTLLYMRQEHKEKALERLVASLRTGGYLFLASPEVPTVKHERLETLEWEGSFFFRKLQREASRQKPAREPPRRRERSPKVEGPPSSCKVRDGLAPEAAPAKSAPASAADIAGGLALASSFLDGARRGEKPGDSVRERVAASVAAIVTAIRSNHFEAAGDLIRDFEVFARENHASQYLKALCAKHEGRPDQAIDLWERARLYEPGFWPALFQAGMSYEKANPERARVLLRECLDAMDHDAGGEAFGALLEGFDAPYYRRMAVRLLARMGDDR